MGLFGKSKEKQAYEAAEAAMARISAWHEVHMDVRLPDRDEYRATRKVALSLASMPEFRPGFEVPVLVDPDDRDVVLITQRLS